MNGLEGDSPTVEQEIASRSVHTSIVLRWIYIGAGWCALGIGIIGIVVPLLPTTPFVLLAAFFFSRGSTKLHLWLRRSRIAGEVISTWELHHAISRRTKVVSTLLMVGLISYPIVFQSIPVLLKVVAVAVVIAVLTFIWTRPSGPRSNLD